MQVSSFREMYIKTTVRLSPYKKFSEKSTNGRCWGGRGEEGIISHHLCESELNSLEAP